MAATVSTLEKISEMIITGYGTTGYASTYKSSIGGGSSSNGNVDSFFANRQTAAQMHRTLQQLDELEKVLSSATSARTQQPQPVVSSSSFNIQVEASSTRIQSTEEITRFITSYNPSNPDWQNLSSANLTITGTYDGAMGQGDLSFDVVQGGIVGLDTIRIAVSGPGGNNVGIFEIANADDAISIGNGLSMRLAAGLIANNDRATTALIVDSNVAPNIHGAFNLSGGSGPGFEEGLSVTSGSFTVNGELIAVAADDSIFNVLQSITGSAAMVTAYYDSDAERIQLVHNLYGADHEIIVDNDTSGFLAATKLSSAVHAPGQFDESQRPLGSVDAFANVRSGDFSVNGRQYQLDISVDSLHSIVQSIETPAQASLIADKQRLSIGSDGTVESISLQSGATRLFPSLHIPDGDYHVLSKASSGLSKRQSYRAADAIEVIRSALDTTKLDTSVGHALDSAIAGIIEGIDDSLLSRLKKKGLELSSLDRGLFDLTQDSRRRFTRSIQRSDSELLQFLLGDKNKAGFIEEVRTAIIEVNRRYGVSMTVYA